MDRKLRCVGVVSSHSHLDIEGLARGNAREQVLEIGCYFEEFEEDDHPKGQISQWRDLAIMVL